MAQNDKLKEAGNVDQIREILFGNQSREMQQQFDKVNTQFKLFKEDILTQITQIEREVNSQLNGEVEILSKKIKTVVTQQKEEFSELRDSALKQEKRLINTLETNTDEIDAKREQLRKELQENKTHLQQQSRNLREELLNTLDEKFSQLGEDKLSKLDAAEIMMETAMRLKGTPIDEQLARTELKKTK